MRKAIPILASLFMVLCGLAFAAGQKEGTPVKLVLFTGKVETVDWMNDVVNRFNASQKAISVTQEYQKDASSVMKVKFASGDVPDITTVVNQSFVDANLYRDLSGEAFWTRIIPSIKELCADVKTGKQFRVATNVTTAGIFYNKTMFATLGLKPALDWTGFVSNLQAIKTANPGVTPLFLAGKDSWTLGHFIEFVAHGIVKQQLGITGSRKAFIYNQTDRLRFDAADGPIASFAAALMELQSKGLINPDAVTATYDNQKDALASGKAGMISQGMWVYGDLLKLNPSVKDTVGFAPFPAITAGTKPVTLSAEDSVYAVTSGSKHQAEALTFLSYLFQIDNQKTYSELLKQPSAFNDVNADWGPLKDQVKTALQLGVNIPFTDTPAGFSGDDAGRMVQELLSGTYATPVAFAKSYREAWDKAWNASQK
jgi:raffinose/stachyose/melibiose transport system substrate-binding protein